MTKTFLGLEKVTWINIAINIGCFFINAAFYAASVNLASAMCMGFHIGLIFMSIVIDRIFLSDMRRELESLQQYLAKVKS